MENVILEANVREKTTKASRNKVRNAGRVTGVFYSRHAQTVALDVDEKAINPLVFTSKTHLISLQVKGKEEHECIIKNVQFDPITDKVIHFDLLGLTKGEKIELDISISFVGSSIGVKEGGVLQIGLHKLTVECLPKNVPESIDINIENINIGDSVHVRDLNYENLTILNPGNTSIVSVTHPKVEVEPVADELAEVMTEPELIGKSDKDSEEEEEVKDKKDKK